MLLHHSYSVSKTIHHIDHFCGYYTAPEPHNGYRDQIVTCDVGVSLHSQIPHLFMKYSNDKRTVLCIPVSVLVFCAFSMIPFLIQSFIH